MIDEEGYRANVGIILVNKKGKLFLARRIGQNAWQFPQGGILDNETPEDALFRELKEEIGLSKKSVRLVSTTKGWLRYRLPRHLMRSSSAPGFVGQKQKWFLLEFLADDQSIKLDHHKSPEFDQWRWVSFWYPLKMVISFKRNVYRKALKEFLETDFMRKLQAPRQRR